MLTFLLTTLCPIAMMTFTSPDLAAVEARYERYLHYELRAEGTVSAELAASWQSPNVAGRRYILLGPASGQSIYMRAVEAPQTPGFVPLKSYGWTTAEIVVQDTYTLSASLKGSPFVEETPNRVISIDFTDDIVNSRVVGPDGDALYLTQFDDVVPNFPFARPHSFVDHILMTIQTSRDPREAQIFYEDLFHLPGVSPFRTGEEGHNLHVMNLPDGCILELDPPDAATTERPRTRGELPPGMAIATYYMETLDRDDLTYLSAPRAFEEAPYVKRRAATLTGPSGELIELMEIKMR